MENHPPTQPVTEEVPAVKRMHGFVTASLFLMLIGNSLIGFFYVFAKDVIAENLPTILSPVTMFLLLLIGITNAICAVLLLQWKKNAFWWCSLNGVIAFVISLYIGMSIGQSSVWLLSVGFLFLLLQIKKDGVSAWKNLE